MRVNMLVASLFLTACAHVNVQNTHADAPSEQKVDIDIVREFAQELQRTTPMRCDRQRCVSEVTVEAAVDGDLVTLHIQLDRSTSSDDTSSLSFLFNSKTKGTLMIEDVGLNGSVDAFITTATPSNDPSAALSVTSCFHSSDPSKCTGLAEGWPSDARDAFYGFIVTLFLEPLKKQKSVRIAT